MAGLLDDIRAAQQRQSQGLLSHVPAQRVTGRQVADAAQAVGLLTAPIPVVGDVMGLLGDAAMYAAKPEERTLGNMALTALGVLPFVPSAAGKVGKALDMSTAARMKRAAEHGFTVDALHGTAKDIAAFDPARLGVNTRADGGELGYFFTKKPALADGYAEIASRGGWYGRAEPGAPAVYPVKLKLENPKMFASASDFYREGDKRKAAGQTLAQWREELQKQGHDGIMVRADGEEIVVFDARNIRSRSAAFDPAKRDSSNILASVAGAGLLSPAIIASMRDEQQ